MATIRDVARRAGVSVGTVSHYLNGTTHVSEGTSTKIRNAIDALGYRVDLGARGLRSRHTKSVGLLLPNISNPYYAEIARAFEHEVRRHGYQVWLCDSDGHAEHEDAYLSDLVARRVDGVAMIYAEERSNLAALSTEFGAPIVFADRGVDGVVSVTSDNWLGGVLAARHLVKLGHRDIAILAGEPDVRNVQERIAGFENELARNGLSVSNGYILEGRQERAFGSRVSDLLALDVPPTAVFATNDIVAIGAWQELMELGVKVPEDVSLVGFDDIDMAGLIFPPLTTIAQDKEAMGCMAARCLLELIEGDRGKPTSPIIPTKLVVRGSTGPYPTLQRPKPPEMPA